MLFILLGLLIFWFLVRNVESAPVPESQEDLIKQGYTNKEAKKEARAQRQERRSQLRAIRDASSTARNTVKTVKKLLK